MLAREASGASLPKTHRMKTRRSYCGPPTKAGELAPFRKGVVGPLLATCLLVACGPRAEGVRATADQASHAGSSGAGSAGAGSSGGLSGVGAAASAGAASGGIGGAAAGGASGSPQQDLGLNDVSFLYPLPDWDARDTLIAAAANGDEGALVPAALYAQLAPPLVEGAPMAAQDNHYASLRVVGVRVDPCFPVDASATPGCSKQIRLVLQPIAQDPTTGQLTTIDAAVHALYLLDDDTWLRLVEDLRALRSQAGGITREGPLRVHPVLQAEGLAGPYAAALRSMVLRYAGEATLDQLAFMNLTKKDVSWAFAKAARQGASFSRVDVPLVSVPSQSASVNLLDESAEPVRNVLVSPAPDNPWILSLANLSAAESSADAAMREALLTDNPTSTKNPLTVDCASCHLTTRNLSYAVRARALSTDSWPERFSAEGYDLNRMDEVGDDPRSLHSFGYFGRKSSIAGRTIHESALVARALSLE